MTTRLDRLVVLLETGSTALVRNTAAQQLGDIQRQHPHELYNLLARVAPYLRNREWECRVAAGKAIAGIAGNVPQWDPNAEDMQDVKHENGLDTIKEEEAEVKKEEEEKLTFAEFDPLKVVRHGEKLLGSAGKEYDVAREYDLSTAEGIAKQKQLVNKRLGLGSEVFDADLIDIDDLTIDVSSQDTKLKGRRTSKSHAETKLPKLTMPPPAKLESPASATTPGDGLTTPTEGMSARQLNVLKRKAKLQKSNASNKVRVIDYSQSTAGRRTSMDINNGASTPHPIKQEDPQLGGDYFSITEQPADSNRVVLEHKAPTVPALAAYASQPETARIWPFEGLVEILLLDLGDPAWETRHGAAIGLREVFRLHGAGAGRQCGVTRGENDKRNAAYLEDIALRCCCVFLLDRFGDYVSDQVVAPIRESVAQLLGAVVMPMPPGDVVRVFRLLRRLVLQNEFLECGPVWEICHGGMLGLKYLVAVREDVFFSVDEVLDGVIECVLSGLGDHDDDVRAVAAATLVPVAEQFIVLRPSAVQSLIDTLWSSLEDLRDDLSASTGSVMDLLAKLFSIPNVLESITTAANTDEEKSFAVLIPRLFPFLRHTIRTVRLAVLRALRTFLSIRQDRGTSWISARAMRLIFQNVLFEQVDEVRELSLQVWGLLLSSISPAELRDMLHESILPIASLLFTPIGTSRNNVALESSFIIRPSGSVWAPANVRQETTTGKRGKKKEVEDWSAAQNKPHNLDGPVIRGDVDLVGEHVMIKSRISGATAFGQLIASWPEEGIEVFRDILANYLVSRWTSPRWLACMTIEESARSAPDGNKLGILLRPTINSLIDSATSGPIFLDLVPFLQTLRRQCQALENVFVDHGKLASSKVPVLAVLVEGEPDAGPHAFSFATATSFVEKDFEKLNNQLSSINRARAAKLLKESRESLQDSIDEFKGRREVHERRIASAASSAILWLGDLGNKLNPIIQGIMNAVKAEEDEVLQRRSAQAIAKLITLCVDGGRTKVSDKLIKNLSAFLCVDTTETPEFHPHQDLSESILSLKREEEKRDPKDVAAFAKTAAEARVKRTGAQSAHEELASAYGSDLFSKVPRLKECMSAFTIKGFTEGFPEDMQVETSTFGQSIIDEFFIVRTLLPRLHPSLVEQLREMYGHVVTALHCRYSVIRFAAARCFAMMCKVDLVAGMKYMVDHVLPMVTDQLDVKRRQGAIECIYHLVDTLDVEILPYVIFLIVPVMGRMSDSDNDVRLLATETFATLVKLVPLEAGIPDPPGMSKEMLAERDEERKFIAQMLDGSKVEPFKIPVAIQADLRKYQQDGVNWLAFLNKYHLHGVLCDDMGLGKTLQTICIVASDHYLRAERYTVTQLAEDRPLPTLVVCPPTITGHWQQEISNYAPFLKALVYVGNPNERQKLRPQIASQDIVITSYDICRNDTAIICQQNFNYCVLDEGHIIKNAKAKVTMACKRVQANHRLILSGTPVQNNVLELWSLFDFLMPGFLGTEKFFHDKFAKPIAASRDSKSSSKEQEAGALALEALHKQVLPFLLRRMKEDVLADLPPKIIQDYYCELSPLQKRLYEDFAKQQGNEIQQDTESKEGKQHIFQALQYMRKLCNHPGLVLQPKHPKYDEITSQLKHEGSSIWDVKNAPKLQALTELLIDSGITGGPLGAKSEVEALTSGSGVVSQHRALIFCQVREMIDRVEKDVLKAKLPGVTYLRLDGSVDPKDRFGIVEKFNADPTIDLLLLTTHVGGLGLNLTGADTVIFVEHDWNPMKDLQAMDRAHRIGQKRVVNVYRLITKDTLEEKIMGLQTFKLNIASSIVNQQNAALATMNTDQILDLFNVKASDPSTAKANANQEMAIDAEGNPIKKGGPNVLEGLSELWDEREYEDEYDMGDYLSSLKTAKGDSK